MGTQLLGIILTMRKLAAGKSYREASLATGQASTIDTL